LLKTVTHSSLGWYKQQGSPQQALLSQNYRL
jgi:hypothetical protein